MGRSQSGANAKAADKELLKRNEKERDPLTVMYERVLLFCVVIECPQDPTLGSHVLGRLIRAKLRLAAYHLEKFDQTGKSG